MENANIFRGAVSKTLNVSYLSLFAFIKPIAAGSAIADTHLHGSGVNFGKPFLDTTVRALPGRLSTLSVSHSRSGLFGAFVWARRAINGRNTAISGPRRRRSGSA